MGTEWRKLTLEDLDAELLAKTKLAIAEGRHYRLARQPRDPARTVRDAIRLIGMLAADWGVSITAQVKAVLESDLSPEENPMPKTIRE
jgi:hypothetical protein